MFFNLSKQQDTRSSNHFQLGKLWLNIDAGWSMTSVDGSIIVYKGYANDYLINTILEDIIADTVPKFDGNFCVFRYDVSDQQLKIYTSRSCGFALYHSDDSLSNWIQCDNRIYADFLIENIDQDLNITVKKHDPIGDIITDVLTEDEVVDEIYRILYSRIERFLSTNTLPVNVFLSGGIDTMLVYSFVKKITDNYRLIAESHLEFDEFWCKNKTYISSRHWAYSQIHHWREPCILCSGAPGDEFMLRAPETANLFLMNLGTNIPMQLDNDQHYLQRNYLTKEKHLNLYKQQATDPMIRMLTKDKRFLFRDICNKNANDKQHWHLGHTLTFTPLHDMEIMKLIMRLPAESAIAQILDSKISKRLIAMNDSNLLRYLSTEKNSEPLSNLWELLDFLSH